MAWDRFAYVLNNPLRFIDPSGNTYDCWDDEYRCDEEPDPPDWNPDPDPWDDPDDPDLEYEEHDEIWLNDYSEDELRDYWQIQFNNTSCASYAQAMALNLRLGMNLYKGGRLTFWNTVHGYGGMFFGTPPRLQVMAINRLSSYHAKYSSGTTVGTLVENLRSGHPTIVSISYGDSEFLNIPLGHKEGVGHAMVLVGANTWLGEFIFLNPLKKGLDRWVYTHFIKRYEQQSNIFIPSGSAVTIYP